MQPRLSAPHEILLPVKPAFIVITLLAALMINMLPWSWPLLAIKPDFVALVLLYWCIQEPRKIGFTAAWILGIVMDVADSSLMGQHALAYSVLAFAGLVLHNRVLRFTLKDQVLHVIPLLLLNDAIVLALRMFAGGTFPGWSYFLGSVVGGALWPLVYTLLKAPQRPKSDPDRV
jgi:rod shape-determining protein MreD